MDQKNLALIRFRQRFQQTSRCKLRFPQSTPKSNTTFRAYRPPVRVSSMPIARKQNFGYPCIEKSRCNLEGPQNGSFAVRPQGAQSVGIELDFRRGGMKIGSIGYEAYGACLGPRSIQGALGASQYFDAINVIERHRKEHGCLAEIGGDRVYSVPRKLRSASAAAGTIRSCLLRIKI